MCVARCRARQGGRVATNPGRRRVWDLSGGGVCWYVMSRVAIAQVVAVLIRWTRFRRGIFVGCSAFCRSVSRRRRWTEPGDLGSCAEHGEGWVHAVGRAEDRIVARVGRRRDRAVAAAHAGQCRGRARACVCRTHDGHQLRLSRLSTLADPAPRGPSLAVTVSDPGHPRLP